MCSEGRWDYVFQVFKLEQFLSRDMFIIFTKPYIWITGKENKIHAGFIFFPPRPLIMYITMRFELEISFCLEVKSLKATKCLTRESEKTFKFTNHKN